MPFSSIFIFNIVSATGISVCSEGLEMHVMPLNCMANEVDGGVGAANPTWGIGFSSQFTFTFISQRDFGIVAGDRLNTHVMPLNCTWPTRLVAELASRMPLPSTLLFMKRTRMPSSSNSVATCAPQIRCGFRESNKYFKV